MASAARLSLLAVVVAGLGCDGEATLQPRPRLSWLGVALGDAQSTAVEQLRAMGWTVQCVERPNTVLHYSAGVLHSRWVDREAAMRLGRCRAYAPRTGKRPGPAVARLDFFEGRLFALRAFSVAPDDLTQLERWPGRRLERVQLALFGQQKRGAVLAWSLGGPGDRALWPVRRPPRWLLLLRTDANLQRALRGLTRPN